MWIPRIQTPKATMPVRAKGISITINGHEIDWQAKPVIKEIEKRKMIPIDRNKYIILAIVT